MQTTLGLALSISLVVLAQATGREPHPTHSVRIAVEQQNGNPGKPDENRTKALRFAAEAMKKGAEIILSHEEMLVGCVENAHDLAEPVDGRTTRAFQSLLQGRRALIIHGLTEKQAEKYFISATVVSADGVVANDSKMLFKLSKSARQEPAYDSPSDRLVTFEFNGSRCDLMICYDGDFPELTRDHANRDGQIEFWLNNRPGRGYEEVKELALKNSMIMATSSPVQAPVRAQPLSSRPATSCHLLRLRDGIDLTRLSLARTENRA